MIEITTPDRSRFLLRPWIIEVEGFDPHTVFAASRGKALALDWRAYCDALNPIPFFDFLRRAKAYGGLGNPDHFGKRITVEGRPAFLVQWSGRDPLFVWPDSETMLRAHHSDVTIVQDGEPEA